jgi:hypothetical protein
MIALIQWIQSKGAVGKILLPRDDDVLDAFGIGRSTRHRYTIHSTNVGIVDLDITRLTRW